MPNVFTPVEFEPTTHQYRVGGLVLPSVTQILKACGITRDYGPDPTARERGTYVHKMVAADIYGDLDDKALAPEWLGWLESWRKAKRMLQIRDFLAVERIYGAVARGFAGTVDLIYGNGLALPTICDFKTGEEEDWHKLQLAGYLRLVGVSHYRQNIYLRADGKLPKMTMHKSSARDLCDWDAIFRTFQLQHKGGTHAR